ncbi:hypothetical protein IH575_03860 [Candidatus Dojkabacteria bacterium]|nr:hypothetical protein [Candidatus Dojkabacteria bacterium]
MNTDHDVCVEMHRSDRHTGGNPEAAQISYILTPYGKRQSLDSLLAYGSITEDMLKQALAQVNWADPAMFKNIRELCELLAQNPSNTGELVAFIEKALTDSEYLDDAVTNLSEVIKFIFENNPALYMKIQEYFDDKSEVFGVAVLNVFNLSFQMEA